MKVFPTDSRHSNGHKLYPSPTFEANIFQYSNKVEFTHSLLSVVKKQLASQVNIPNRYIADGLSFKIQSKRFISVRCIPPSLRLKTGWRATLLFPTRICFYRWGRTIYFALPFTTTVRISIPISKTFGSWKTISPLRQTMVFLSRISFYMPGLVTHINILFWGRFDLKIKHASLAGLCQGISEIVSSEVLCFIRGS